MASLFRLSEWGRRGPSPKICMGKRASPATLRVGWFSVLCTTFITSNPLAEALLAVF